MKVDEKKQKGSFPSFPGFSRVFFTCQNFFLWLAFSAVGNGQKSANFFPHLPVSARPTNHRRAQEKMSSYGNRSNNQDMVLVRSRVQTEHRRVWSLLRPQPRQTGPRRFLREGRIKQYSPRQKRVKKKYMFLFSDCLLITRRDSSKRYQMKIFCFLRAIQGVRLIGIRPKRTEWEFHLHTGKKNLIFFAISRVEAEAWIEAIEYARAGSQGPVPSSVVCYGDENQSTEQHDDHHSNHEERPASLPAFLSGRSPVHHRDNDYSDSDSDSLPPVEPLILPIDLGVDFTNSDAAFAVASQTLPGQQFNPFGLQTASQSSGFLPVSPSAPPASTSSHSFLPPAASSSASASAFPLPHMDSSSALVVPAFVPDTSQGVLPTLDAFGQWLSALPKESVSPYIFTLLAQGRNSVVALIKEFNDFRTSPSPAGEQSLVNIDRQCSEFGARLKAEAAISSQTPNHNRQNLAAALLLVAVTLEQFTSQVLLQLRNVALC